MNHRPTSGAASRLWRLAARWCREHPVRAGAVAGWYQQTSGVISSLIVLPIIIRILGSHEAGQWFALQSFVTLIGLADFGFSMVISRQVSYSLQRTNVRTAITSDLIETAPGWNGVRQIYAASRRIFFWVEIIAIAASITIYHFILPHTNLALHGSLQSALVWY